jgi:hypothetical protein
MLRIQHEVGRLTNLSVATAAKSGNRLYKPTYSCPLKMSLAQSEDEFGAGEKIVTARLRRALTCLRSAFLVPAGTVLHLD